MNKILDEWSADAEPMHIERCPFCGGEGKVHMSQDNVDYGGVYEYLVACTDCLASTGRYIMKEAAIQAWNKRDVKDGTSAENVIIVEPGAVIHCEDCGMYYTMCDGRRRCSVHNAFTQPGHYCSFAANKKTKTNVPRIGKTWTTGSGADTMNKEEAAAVLEKLVINSGDGEYNYKVAQRMEKALAMAIKALRQSEVVRCRECAYRYSKEGVWFCPFGRTGGDDFYCGLGVKPKPTEGGNNGSDV